MSSSILLALVAVVAVAVLAILMRRARPAATDLPAPPVADNAPVDAPEPEESDGQEEEADSSELIAVTSDGLAFAHDDGTIDVSPVPADAWSGAVQAQTGSDTLRPGDLIAARVKRGAPDYDPWRLEALGRDRELRAWRFETEEAARAALELVERCIVRAPRDENGDEIPLGDEAYDEARRLEEEIERELATMPEVGESPSDPARRPIE